MSNIILINLEYSESDWAGGPNLGKLKKKIAAKDQEMRE
jgi:hypothetical protein